jgi:hypothetical protein
VLLCEFRRTFAFGTDIARVLRVGWDADSKGLATSLATFNIDLIPRLINPCQSLALSSEPSHMPGMISIGPSRYAEADGSPSSLRRKIEDALAPGSEAIEGRLGWGRWGFGFGFSRAMGEAMLGARPCEMLVPEMLSERRLTLREGFDGFDGAAVVAAPTATAAAGAGAMVEVVVSSGCGIAGGMSAGAVPSSSRSGPANTIKDAVLDDEARLRGAGGPLLRFTPAC